MIFPALQPYAALIKGALAVLLLACAWYSGYHVRDARAELEAEAARAAQLAAVVKAQAEVSARMGEAVRDAQAREREALEKARAQAVQAQRREAAWRTERETNADCDAWMRQPVPCSLRVSPDGR